MFWRGTVLPLANRIGSSLAHWLAPVFGESVKLVADTDSAPALAKDRAAAWEQVGKAGSLTVNESGSWPTDASARSFKPERLFRRRSPLSFEWALPGQLMQ